MRSPVRPDSPLAAARVRRSDRPVLTSVAIVGCLLAAVAVLVGLAFAGSRQELASGTHVAGVDVGGLTLPEASSVLQRRFTRVADEPVLFRARGATFRFTANQLGVDPNWRAAVRTAGEENGGFAPVRGFRRLHTRVFGADVFPQVAVSDPALEFALDEIAKAVDEPSTDAALVRQGLHIRLVREHAGAELDRSRAARTMVHALASVERGHPATVPLKVAVAAPAVTAADLTQAARRARIALSAPVVLAGEGRSWRIPRWRIARILALPRGGSSRLALQGKAADRFFSTLAKRVDKPPADASFDVFSRPIRVIPARDGVALDVAPTAARLLRAATSRARRTARVAVVRSAPSLSTEDARAMGVTEELSTYKTYNAGSWDRTTNLRLGVHALDGTLVAPGSTFSLNAAIGERTAARGFRPAPVIIGTKYEQEIGGGTSQVATTAFNAAWEAGVRITERNPHALYISRYPTGRDATVYWPSLDLKFQNDTPHWILVKGFAEGDGIRVSLYGGERRRVESSPGTFEVTGPMPVRRILDPKLPKGTTILEEEGAAPSATSVTRTIYGEDGALLRRETWNTTYKAEPRVVRVGTKVKAPLAKRPPKGQPTPPKATEPQTTTEPQTNTTTTESTTPLPPH
jgi:vancomycin resistance protein YoaR